MWKQRVHACLGLWRVKYQLSLAILLQYRIVVIHHYRTVGMPVRCGPDLEHREIQAIRHGRDPDESKDCRDKDSSQPRPEVRHLGRDHEARL